MKGTLLFLGSKESRRLKTKAAGLIRLLVPGGDENVVATRGMLRLSISLPDRHSKQIERLGGVQSTARSGYRPIDFFDLT